MANRAVIVGRRGGSDCGFKRVFFSFSLSRLLLYRPSSVPVNLNAIEQVREIVLNSLRGRFFSVSPDLGLGGKIFMLVNKFSG